MLTPREVPAFIDVTLAFLEHCNWQQVAVAPKHREWNPWVKAEHDSLIRRCGHSGFVHFSTVSLFPRFFILCTRKLLFVDIVVAAAAPEGCSYLSAKHVLSDGAYATRPSGPCQTTVGTVCEKFRQVCISEGRASEALLPLRGAALEMGRDTASLTPIHPEFLQVSFSPNMRSLSRS